MQILHIRPEPPGGIGNTIARFDVALSDDVRVFGLRITERAAGGYSVYSPNARGARVVTFSANLVNEIARAALAALQERKPHDQRAA
ncbi:MULTISPECIES: hypothetical protein [unclassified Mesorhizobium]|uniref:hypothetical protein n=1 Tax=unclassified Mesorhizobium TaxID=325217 RepID=UPI000FCA7344|nr:MULTISPECIES: hypothetical protein [unclassified Mesorhizobium]RUW69277.1 hypothetical protein EOA31_23490 [Mesorhizobium sp. M4B.F.Ca.ET.049.02.1.2]RVD70778.1 hypothetical protein EN751_18905 [Mesorhizobium sp. M4A.F.Ca.ET.029.04.2.1]TGV26445.1 hypothetical protein EN786_13100 [Mesorhizobium sp. M4B.F.Ca.ET.143.01.1.1]TIW36535.1 MAG: hypothetical protein E5V62_06145 [Mesorhizobium sp.]